MVGTSNARYVSRVREGTERGRTRRLAVAVGDFHTSEPLPDSVPAGAPPPMRDKTPTRAALILPWALARPAEGAGLRVNPRQG
jgi:hypothetical protein